MFLATVIAPGHRKDLITFTAYDFVPSPPATLYAYVSPQTFDNHESSLNNLVSSFNDLNLSSALSSSANLSNAAYLSSSLSNPSGSAWVQRPALRILGQ